MNRAFLVGINNYPPPNKLNGCVNDVNDMANFLVSKCNFKATDIRLLTDERATAENILQRLGWLLNGVQKGDRILFHYSGHGAQLATRSPTGETDGLDEVICPVNFDFDDNKTMIRDKDFVRIFSGVPDGVEFIWVSDSCFSGGLLKGFAKMPENVKAYNIKTISLPADIAWRNKSAIDNNKKPLTMKGAAKKLGLALISGCKESQESADADINNRYNGALTYFLLQTLKGSNGLKTSVTNVVKKVVKDLQQKRFSQRPELLGNKIIMEKSFLA